MRYAIIVLALLGVLASPRPAAADVTGNELLEVCKADELACVMYTTGWRDAFNLATIAQYGAKHNSANNPKLGICIPGKVQTGQVRKVLLKYLRDNPAMRHEKPFILTFKAMREALPCR